MHADDFNPERLHRRSHRCRVMIKKTLGVGHERDPVETGKEVAKCRRRVFEVTEAGREAVGHQQQVHRDHPMSVPNVRTGQPHSGLRRRP
jgi:hypothetical protein